MAQLGELQRQIEDLALRLVVGDVEAGSAARFGVSALAEIRDRAACDQAAHLVVMAEATLGAVACAKSPESILSELQDGVARLQEGVERPKSSANSEQKALQSALALAQDPELMSDFIMESREHLVQMEGLLLILEQNPRDSEALNAVFRGFHNIKGLAGFLELWQIQSLAHEVETVLDRARNSGWIMTGAAIDVILESADYLNRWLNHLEALLNQRQSQPPPPDPGLEARIEALSSNQTQSEHSDGLAAIAAALVPPDATAATVERPAQLDPEPATPIQRTHTMSVKVDTAKLDSLVDMAGEMVIAESLVRNDPELKLLQSSELQRKIAHLTRITTELQRTAMAMRLVSVGPLFRRMARLVRDLSRQFGKQVEMETQGEELDLDRTIMEELADPLMHMVRNALDHGIETPAERQANGKSPTATLLLKAHHHAGQIVIEIADDGRGLNRDSIKARGIQRRLIHADQQLSDSEIDHLIFEPGFSTAAQVTNVSGRGVGMDVVRRHIDKLRGRIEIHSRPGLGASFVLKLPLTLAIIEGLVVGVGEERYIVPLLSVREMLRPTAETIWTVKHRAEMALVRGSLLPILRLHRLFQVKPRTENLLEAVLLVAEAEGKRFCLMVDELIGKQEVLIKPLGETFKAVSSVAGGAILGDGRVGLILDLERLFQAKQNDPSL